MKYAKPEVEVIEFATEVVTNTGAGYGGGGIEIPE